MSWIYLALAAQLVLALVAFFDKYIVTSERGLPQPFVYAFMVCLLSGATISVFLLGTLPFSLIDIALPDIRNVEAPSLAVVAFSFLAAYTFFSALASLFSAFREADASDVVPVVGAVSAIATFSLSYIFLGTRLSPNFLWGILVLALGTLLMSRLRFPASVGFRALHAGIFFALHYVTFKGLLEITTFDNAFFWSRIGFVGVALSLVLIPEYFEKIRAQTRTARAFGGVLIVLNKILAGIGTILILKATELGDVAVVQALGGVQFVFLLLIGFMFGKSIKVENHREKKHPHEFLHKAISVAVITVGFFILFI